MSWDGTLSSGGVSKHGSPAHINSGVTPGFYNAPFGVTVDSTGVATGAYQAWSPEPTYPANSYTLGSDSRLYKAVISNLNHDPTTDDGTNWISVSIPLVGSSNGQVAIWNASTQRYEPGTIPTGSGLPVGTNNQIIVNDGSTPYVAVDMSGDATIVNTGAVTVSKSHGNAFPSAATVKGDVWYGSNANTLSALAGNTTTTKKFLTETGTGSAANAPAWSTIAQSDVLPTGTDTQTLYNNSGTWAATSFLRTDAGNNRLLVGNPGSPDANIDFQVWGTGGTGASTPVMIEAVEGTSSANSVSMRAYNSGASKGAEIGYAGTSGDFFPSTTGGDAIVRATGTGAGSLWLGQGTTAIAKFDSSALGANKFLAAPDGSSGALGIRSIVAADIPSLALSKLTSGGVAGKVVYDNGTNIVESAAGADTQTLYMSGTTPSFSSVLTNNGSTVGITPAASNVGLTITAASAQRALVVGGNGSLPAIEVTNTASSLLTMTSSAAMGSASGAAVIMAANAAATGSGSRYGTLQWGKNIGGTISVYAQLGVFSEEDNTTNWGTKMQFRTGVTGANTAALRFEIRGNGDIVCNALNIEPSTSATGAFTWLPTCNGVPTGTPANTYTGAAPVILDRSNNRLYGYMGSSWQNLSPSAATGAPSLSIVYLSTPISGHTDTLSASTDVVLADTSAGGLQGIILPSTAARGTKEIVVRRIVGGIANVTISAGAGDAMENGTITLTTAKTQRLIAYGNTWYPAN